jgi:hypothetical protein
MNLKNRVQRLEKKADMMAKGRGRTVSSRYCKGAGFDELMHMVEEGLLPESVPVLANIVQQIEEYHQRPARKLPDGEMIQDIHGFVYWLWGLQAGCSSLPEKIPPELLLAWRNGYTNHPAGVSPVPLRRCEDCMLVLPNCTPDGFGPSINPCPVCGSENISHKKLSGPPWDPMHIYTPLPTPMGPHQKRTPRLVPA